MKYRFVSLTNAPYNGDVYDMMKKMGVKGTKWPDAGMSPMMVDGIKVWVTPRAEPANRAMGIRKSSTHRVMCQCPGCGDIMSAGRLHQHKCDAQRRQGV